MADDKAEARELAIEEMRKLEAGEAPTTLEGWPSGPAQYLTYGSDDDQYGTGITSKLGPSNVRHHADGSVTIAGEKVDNPGDYKGEALFDAATGPR